MPCCVPGGSPAEAATSEKIRCATLEAMQREKLSEIQNALDQYHTVPAVDTSKLDDLSISCGIMLDVDNWLVTSPTDESMEMIDAINLRLPRREFKPKARPSAHSYYEYGGQLAYLAKDGSDRPHAACMMLESGCKDADGLLLRSEVDAAICMSQLQLRDGHFTNHYTKPILITTILRKRVARLTQAHFDDKKNRLILRQSRLLDLSGKDAGDDAWLLLRWMASTPVGQTKYPEATGSVDRYYDEKSSLAPP